MTAHKRSGHKLRADQRLFDMGLAESRAQAQSIIMAGQVMLDDKPILKSGQQVKQDAMLQIKAKPHPWVSRGGVKLNHGLNHFGFSAQNLIAADIGSSTGGFSDVLLHHGATKVYAIDVGRAQLHNRLLQDSRVISLEQTNARYLNHSHIPEKISAITIDVSFIGLEKIIPAILPFAQQGCWIIALVKPQFQLKPNMVSKGGVVTDPEYRQLACDNVVDIFQTFPNWKVSGIIESPITGAKEGNIEYLIGAEFV